MTFSWGEGESGTLLVPVSLNIKAPDVADAYLYLAWRQQLLFEDACAIWDTLGRAHRQCALDEWQSG